MMIYLDNAATGGRKPERVIRTFEGALRHHCANPGRGGHKPSLVASGLIYDCRKKVADFFGCDSIEGVCFTSGCTASLNMAIKGILRRGDRVLASSLEHNAVARPLNALERAGVLVDVARVVPTDSEATFNSFQKALKPDTKAIICTHASNVTGEIMPIKQLGELCQSRGIILIVDAAQTAGLLPINMKEMGIHILCAAPHKGLLAPMGVGLLISRIPLPYTIIEGGTGSQSLATEQPEMLPDRLESGTCNLPAILALSAAIDHLKKAGPENLYSRELTLVAAAHQRLGRNPKVVLYTPPPEKNRYMPVLSFNIRGIDSAETAAALNERDIALRGGLHCAPWAHDTMDTINTGTVRLSTSYFNTLHDIDALVAAVNSITKKI